MALKPPPKKGAGTGAAPPPGASNPLNKPPPPKAPPATVAVKAPPPAAVKAPPPAGAPKPAAPSAALKGAPGATRVGSGKVTLSTGRPKASSGPGGQMRGDAKARPQGEVSVDSEKVEDKAFLVLGVKETTCPRAFDDFVERALPRLTLPQTSRAVLEAFGNIDVTAEKVSQCLRANPYLEFQFQRVIESMGKREDLPKLEAAVILLGMQNSRNLVIALQLLRTVRRLHPEWGKDGKLKFSPNETLKYALKTEEMLAGNKEGYSETAFAAGLLFDALGMVVGEIAANDDRKKAMAYIDTVYQHGLRSAQIGMELAKLIPDFTYKKYIFSTCLIHDVGKILLAALNPAYIAFVDECGKKEVPRAVRHYAEEKRFGMTHAMLGAIACRSFKVFRNVERAVLFHHDPYLLKSSNRNMHQLAQLVCLASNIANNFKKTDKLDDPAVMAWRGPELRDLRLDLKTIAQSISRMP